MLRIDDHMTHELKGTFRDVSTSNIEDHNPTNNPRQNLAGGTGVFANFFEEMAEPISFQSSELTNESHINSSKQNLKIQQQTKEVKGNNSLLRDEICPMEAFYGDNSDDDLKILERYRMLVNSYSDDKSYQEDECQLKHSSLDDTLKRSTLPHSVNEYDPNDLSSQLCISYIHRSKPPKVLANRFLLGSTIGRGSYGKVKDAIDLFTLRRHAVKIISKLGVRKIPGGWNQALHESSLMRRLSACRHVVSLVVVLRLENPDRLCLVMEHCLGSVHDLQASGVPSHTAVSSENEFELGNVQVKSPYFKTQQDQPSDSINEDATCKNEVASPVKSNKPRRFHTRLAMISTQVNHEPDSKVEKSKGRKISNVEHSTRKHKSFQQQQQQFRRLPEAQAHAYFLQLIDGLHFLHRNGVIHRDIKPANLLLTSAPGCGLSEFGSPNGTMDLPDHNWLCNSGSQSAFCQRSLANLLALSRGWLVKLTDFGVSASISAFNTNDMVSGGQTTPAVQPPEVAKGLQSIFRWDQIRCRVPFSCQNVLQIFEAIVTGDYSIPGHVSANASELIRKMMHKDPKKRLSLLQIRQQTWFVQDPPAPMSVEKIKVKLRSELPDYQKSSNNESPTDTLVNAKRRGTICWLDPLIYLRRPNSEYPLPHIDDTGARIFSIDEIFNNSTNQHNNSDANNREAPFSNTNNQNDEYFVNCGIAPISVIDRLKVFHNLENCDDYLQPEDMSSFYYSPEAYLQHSNIEKHLANLGIASRVEPDPSSVYNIPMNSPHASPVHFAETDTQSCYLPLDQSLLDHQFGHEKSLKSNIKQHWCHDLAVPVYEATIQPTTTNVNEIPEPPACPADLPISVPTAFAYRSGSLPGPIVLHLSDPDISRYMEDSVISSSSNNNPNNISNQKTWHCGSRPVIPILSHDFHSFHYSKQSQHPQIINSKDHDQVSSDFDTDCTNFDNQTTHSKSIVSNKKQKTLKQFITMRRNISFNSMNRLSQWFTNPFNVLRNRVKTSRHKDIINNNGNHPVSPSPSSNPRVYQRNVNSATELASINEKSPLDNDYNNSVRSTDTLPRSRGISKPCSRIFSRRKFNKKK
ncbi:Serine/threonine-protein kinase STK11 [Schistosoma japonicum]|uniref:non-specific serine/threonine protein kinase n=1 Tax=Schistosoma japonicum TaxID=6182 RepID=A0A4Z2DHX4_SCHJA|nr:Serine/threonine-protein kinase STK11 [Schistosoma japonicum]